LPAYKMVGPAQPMAMGFTGLVTLARRNSSSTIS
jgi:hypothetical protein